MTKADVLDELDNLQACTSYKIDGTVTKQVPFQMDKKTIDPVYESFRGWQQNISGIKKSAELPKEMNQYIQFINEYVQAPVKFVSNGPGTDQIIVIS